MQGEESERDRKRKKGGGKNKEMNGGAVCEGKAKVGLQDFGLAFSS